VAKAKIITELAGLMRRRGREAACVSMLLLSASCVPLHASPAPEEVRAEALIEAAATPATLGAASLPEPVPMVLEAVSPTDAAAINAAIPISAEANPRAPSIVFRAAAAADQWRSLQCLAEVIYYEARSESEEGQRAVAQVVLNRVRHPAYPGSVCGVVYQGPMRGGGGCQFTFTCDGSLSLAPAGFGWLRARRLASEALAGGVYAPVGHATHYHTQQVVPFWAHKLGKTAVIGAHSFYRMPGAWGGPSAFTRRYSGREPAPASIIAERLPVTFAALPTSLSIPGPTYQSVAIPEPAQPNDLPVVTYTDKLPQSQIREEFRNSGRPRDLPRGEGR
jgi:spore germination cell wall hydrolase CwlJ-like protein